MATGVQSWSQTAADNATADSAVNWAEGQAPSSVNNSARAEMASVAKYRDDTAGTLTTGGTSTAYTITSNQTFGSLAELDGNELTVKFNATNGASPTLNVDGLGAKALHAFVGAAVPTGALLENSIHRLTYDNSNNCFVINGWVPIQITSQTAETSPAVLDELAFYDASASANRKITVANFLKVVTSLTAETAVATADELLLYDASASTADKITVENLFKAVNAFTEDTSPDEAADFLLSYDTSANTVKKVKPDNISQAGSAKAWFRVTYSGGTPTVVSSHNIAGITDNGVGNLSWTYTTELATVGAATYGPEDASVTVARFTSLTTGGGTIDITNASGANKDPSSISVVVYG
jgi:hypothetical protein